MPTTIKCSTARYWVLQARGRPSEETFTFALDVYCRYHRHIAYGDRRGNDMKWSGGRRQEVLRAMSAAQFNGRVMRPQRKRIAIDLFRYSTRGGLCTVELRGKLQGSPVESVTPQSNEEIQASASAPDINDTTDETPINDAISVATLTKSVTALESPALGRV